MEVTFLMIFTANALLSDLRMPRFTTAKEPLRKGSRAERGPMRRARWQ